MEFIPDLFVVVSGTSREELFEFADGADEELICNLIEPGLYDRIA